jgi:hypothetical protein
VRRSTVSPECARARLPLLENPVRPLKRPLPAFHGPPSVTSSSHGPTSFCSMNREQVILVAPLGARTSSRRHRVRPRVADERREPNQARGEGSGGGRGGARAPRVRERGRHYFGYGLARSVSPEELADGPARVPRVRASGEPIPPRARRCASSVPGPPRKGYFRTRPCTSRGRQTGHLCGSAGAGTRRRARASDSLDRVELSRRKRERLEQRVNQALELAVIQPRGDWACHRCAGSGDLLIMEGPGPRCLRCARLDRSSSCPRATRYSRGEPSRRASVTPWWFAPAGRGVATSGKACWWSSRRYAPRRATTR